MRFPQNARFYTLAISQVLPSFFLQSYDLRVLLFTRPVQQAENYLLLQVPAPPQETQQNVSAVLSHTSATYHLHLLIRCNYHFKTDL